MACSRPLPLVKNHKPVLNYFGEPIHIPCRSCECCRADKNRMWQDRSKFEFNRHKGSAFVTFTYDNEHLRYTPGFKKPTLDFNDVHQYLDSIRHRAKILFKKYPNLYSNCDSNFSYVGSGEYGDKFKRPHFHIAFLGLDYKQCAKFLKTSWKYGSIDVKPVKDGCFGYITKYIQKQTFGQLRKKMFICKGLQAPKLIFSRGFGSDLYYSNRQNWLVNGFIKKGSHKRIYVPSYYANKMRPYDSDVSVTHYQKRMQEMHNDYLRYKHFNPSLTFNEFKVSNALHREYSLQKRKFVNLESTQKIDSSLIGSRVYQNGYVSRLADEAQEAQYCDKVPF